MLKWVPVAEGQITGKGFCLQILLVGFLEALFDNIPKRMMKMASANSPDFTSSTPDIMCRAGGETQLGGGWSCNPN